MENTQNIYAKHGFKNRKEYLQDLSEEYGVSLEEVYALAQLLGENEDFDGLVSSLQDMHCDDDFLCYDFGA